jgi:hypothetical protein
MTASLKGGRKVFELLEGGTAARNAGRRKLNVFAPLGGHAYIRDVTKGGLF